MQEPNEGFEDVGLNDDSGNKPKKRSFLSRFQDSAEDGNPNSGDAKTHHFSILTGRKRGQSGSGSEMGNMQRPGSKGQAEVAAR